MNDQALPAPPVLGRLWSLFSHIVKRWSDADPSAMRSNWLVFIANRQRVDGAWAGWYAEAAALLDQRVAQMGEAAAYEQLLNTPRVAGQPTDLPWPLARVADEFITLFLALGGFKAYGAVNYLGYIAGANVPGQTPYRTARRPDGGGA